MAPQQNVDPNWSIIYLQDVYPVPSVSGSTAYILNATSFPFGTWINTYGDAQWIAPRPDYSGAATADPAGYYVYRTQFYIPETANLSTVLLSVATSSDNCTKDVLINGVGTGYSMAPGTCPTEVHSFQISGASVTAQLQTLVGDPVLHAVFRPGWNTLDFKVQNLPGDYQNPTGLAARLKGTVDDDPHTIPEPATISGILLGAGILALRRGRAAV